MLIAIEAAATAASIDICQVTGAWWVVGWITESIWWGIWARIRTWRRWIDIKVKSVEKYWISSLFRVSILNWIERLTCKRQPNSWCQTDRLYWEPDCRSHTRSIGCGRQDDVHALLTPTSLLKPSISSIFLHHKFCNKWIVKQLDH